MDAVKPLHIVQRFTFPVAASSEKIFPLLCPVKELEWLGGWACDMIHTASGLNEKGCVFKTKSPTGAETIWVTTRYDQKEGRVEFIQVVRDMMVVNLNISLGNVSDGTTLVTFEYICTSLTENGSKFLSEGFVEQFKQRIAWIEKSMNHYLKTGSMLKA